MKREICSTPTCEHPVQYTTLQLCKRCYQRRWFQLEKQQRYGVDTRLEITVKTMTEDVINKMREAMKPTGKASEKKRDFHYYNKVEVPRSEYYVEMRIKRRELPA